MFPLITEYVERVTRQGLVHSVVIHVPPDYNRIPSREEENKKENIHVHVQSVFFLWLGTVSENWEIIS